MTGFISPMYAINVFAAGPGGVGGCGAPNRTATFKIGAQVMGAAGWNNSQLWYHPLTAQTIFDVYLPLVVK